MVKTSSKKTKFDIVSIGDCTIDAFLHIEEAEVHNTKNGKKLSFNYGDKTPYESLTVLSAGNCNNVAVGSSRLGLKAGYYGTVGGDHNSHVILNKLRDEGVSRDLMSIQKHAQTNFHVVLWYKKDRTILIKHQPYTYKLPAGINSTKWIYLSTVGPRGLKLHTEIVDFLKKNPNIKMAFNPGTYQLRLGLSKLKPLFKHTEILFVNKEEAQMLVDGKTDDFRELANRLHKHGPKTVVITDGLKGSYCLHGNAFYYMGIYPHTPYEATGCGDAYAVGFTSARVRDLSVPEALRWGSRNGASVATKIGPQVGLVKFSQMQKDLKAHKNFQAKIIK